MCQGQREGKKGGGNNLWRKAMKKESTKKDLTLFTTEQLALVLSINEFTLKKLARTKQIPCIYKGGRIVFSLDSILTRFKELEGGAV
jgi:hypothetical protein